MNLRSLRTLAFLATTLGVTALGCSAHSDDGGDNSDDALATSQAENCGGGYCADMAKVNKLFGADAAHKMSKLRDAFTVTVDLGAGMDPVVAETHVFPKPGAPINILPYADGDTFKNAAGTKVRGDEAAAKIYKPGEIGYAVKHHRPLHRTLKLDDPAADMKENFKLYDTHIEIVMGVKKDGHDGVITVNSPQNYQEGGFGDEGSPGDYPMVFAKPVLPSYLSADQKAAFIENIRTMAVAFDAIIEFPGDYNGGDPLGAHDPVRLREHVRNMIKANAGNADAKAYFGKPENQVYCAELAFLSSSAGLHVPLNDAGIKMLNDEVSGSAQISADEWKAFKAAVALHNKHDDAKPSVFVTQNSNTNIHYIDLADLDSAAIKNLKPVYEYAGAQRDAESQKLSLSPMTMADIVQNFMRTHFPREERGEAMAPVQAKVLQAIKPGLLESMGFDDAHKPTDAAAAAEWQGKRDKVEALFAQIVTVVGKDYGNYTAFRTALEPLMGAARQMTGPRTKDTGVGLFTPPSLFHTVMQGEHLGGLMTLQYIAHGLHVTVTKPQ